MRHFLLFSVLLSSLLAPAAAQSLLKVSVAQRQAMGIEVAALQAAENVPLDGLAATVRAPLHESTVVRNRAPRAGAGAHPESRGDEPGR